MAEALKELTGITDKQLDSKIDDDILWELAGHLGNYELYTGMHGFNFNNATMEDLKASAVWNGNQHAMYEALEKWSGTCRSLVEILTKLNIRSIAEKVCEIVVTSRIRNRKTRSSETRFMEPSEMELSSVRSGDQVKPESPPVTVSVEDEINKFENRFIDLRKSALEDITNSKISVSEFRHKLMVVPSNKCKKNFLEHNLLFQKAESVEFIFAHLSFYLSFIDFDLLEHVIEQFCSERLKEDMRCYAQDMKEFKARTTISEALKYLQITTNERENPPANIFYLKMKFNMDINVATLEELEKFGNTYANTLTLSQLAFFLFVVEEDGGGGAGGGGGIMFKEDIAIANDTIMSAEDADALKKLLLAKKIDEFSLAGDNKTYSRVKQHLRELGHVEFAANLRFHLDKEIFASRALDEAMKAGDVSVKITNILLFGMAGTGKTSTKHLLLGLDPPASRNSTPLAEKAEKAQIRQIREASKLKIKGVQADPTSIWQPITSDGLLDFITDAIKCCGKEYESKGRAAPKEIATALKQVETNIESIENVATDSFSSSESDEFTSSALKSPKLVGIEDQDSNSGAFIRTVSNIMKSIQQAYELKDDDASAAREKLGSNWIYLIDSGGQPHFHNLLPLFIPKISVALYILRLSDRLDHHPKIEYYKDGKPVSEYFISETSVLDNYKHLVQSIQSHNTDCKLLCIGTHKDWRSESKDETLDDKNTKLKAFSDQNESVKNMTLFYDLKKKDVIIPLNCKEPDIESKNNASKIRQIVNSSQDIEILVPIWWYALELVIDKFSVDEHRKILSKSECVKIAQNLNKFHELALIEALKFFHKHHIFHYYPDILSEVVFCDTQVLLDKVTELVEHAAYIRDSKDSVFGFGIWIDFVQKGMITFEILSASTFRKHYVDGLFTPNELITIFQYLLIATPSQAIAFNENSTQKDVFYMPSLLSMVPLSKLYEIRTDFLKTDSVPLVLQLKDKWQCCGVFCCLQVYLIQKCHWEVKINDHSPSQNFVQLRHEHEPCSITLIDHLSYFEIHSKISSACSAKQESHLLSLIYHNILSGLESAYKVLNYSYIKPQAAFFCPCCPTESIQSTTPTIAPHLTTVFTKSNQMRCTQQKDEEKYFEFEPRHSNWIAAINNQSQNMDSADQGITDSHLNSIFEVLFEVRGDWYFIGKGIRCTHADLDEIEAKHSSDQRRCLHEMLKRRIQQGGLTCSMLCNSLRQKAVDKNNVAKKVEALKIQCT